MYESYTKQSLPERHYRELLGSALCVFNFNNAFIIKTILKCDDINKYDWYHLTDLESGLLKGSVHETITSKCGDEVERLFVRLIAMRNRIIHSYQITSKAGEQVLATKEPIRNGNRQFEITVEYLMEFIKLNEQLSEKLYGI